MKHLNTERSISLMELRLLPGLTQACTALEHINLETRLCRKAKSKTGFINLSSPFVSAAMQAVTDEKLAIALAQLGGVGVLPISNEQVSQVRKVKQFKAGFQTGIMCLSPKTILKELLRLIQTSGYSTFPVTDNGLFHGKLLGVITDKDFDSRSDLKLSVSERMRRDVQVGVELDDLTKANELMINYGRGFLPIVSEEHTLKAVVFKKDLEHHILHPQANEDTQKRLIVGAAVSTHPKDRERIISLIEEQVDFLVIDASDGHSDFQAETLEFIKENHDIPVIAGNVVTAQGFDFLVAAGADAIKVGMGIGSGCITQEAKATGRGQATAIMDIVKARKDYEDETGNYIPIIADGSVNSPAEICIALALGADSVMMGNYFARCTESPGKLINRYAVNKAMKLKEYWMEGSAKAKSLNSSERKGRYYQGDKFNDEHSNFFEEGVSGWVPHAGSIFDVMPTSLQRLKSSLSSAGCKNITTLHQEAVLEQQSSASINTSEVRNMFIDTIQ